MGWLIAFEWMMRRETTLQLEDTVYHYTKVPAEIWEELKTDEEPYDYYSMEIEGNYDARDGGVPSYK